MRLTVNQSKIFIRLVNITANFYNHKVTRHLQFLKSRLFICYIHTNVPWNEKRNKKRNMKQ